MSENAIRFIRKYINGLGLFSKVNREENHE